MAAPTLSCVPDTEAAKCAVQEQLERILGHTVFRGSKRSAVLLRHVVQCALDGHIGNLKERTLGIEVFGRVADYDTNLDPVVRTAAVDVRKRIALYYHEGGHEHELRIDLPAGSYVPEFSFPSIEIPKPAALTPVPRGEDPNVARPRRAKYWIYVLVGCSLLLVAAAVGVLARPESASQRFWGPVLGESSPILITLGDPSYKPFQPAVRETPAPHEMTLYEHELITEQAAVSDVVALAQITTFLGRAGKSASTRDCLSTTFSDLQHGPNILIAAFDNPWTLRALERLRFHFKMDHTDGRHLAFIEDAKNSASRDWMVDLGAPYTRITQDYAIVGRFRDSETGQITVIAAGLAENGTTIAGEFLSEEKYLETINKMARKDWENKNVEAVIATQVIDGKSGPPRLVALETW